MQPASYREVRRYLRTSVGPDFVARAAKACGMKIVESHAALVKLKAPLNFWSFGESVDVCLGAVDGCSVVDVTSTCVLKTQIADWGKNERNVRRLFEGLDTLLGAHSEYEPCCLCKRCGYLLIGIPTGPCPECGCHWSPSEKPSRRDAGTFRAALSIGVAVGLLQCLVVAALDLLGYGIGLFPWRGTRIGRFLFLFSLGALVSLAVMGLHRLVTRCRRRS